MGKGWRSDKKKAKALSPQLFRNGFVPPAVQCQSGAPPGLLEGDGLARPAAVDVGDLGMPIGDLRSD